MARHLNTDYEALIETGVSDPQRADLFHAKARATALRIIHAFKRIAPEHRETLQALLRNLLKCGILKNPLILQAIPLIAAHYSQRQRDAETFTPKKRNARKVYAHFLRHLYAEDHDKVPAFLDTVWLANKNAPTTQHDRIGIKVFLALGQGKDLRTLDGIPIVVTKKITHFFLQTPKGKHFTDALRTAQVRGLGGSSQLAGHIRKSRLTDVFHTSDPFWTHFIQRLIKNEETGGDTLTAEQVGDMVDYLWDQKFEKCKIIVNDGSEREAPPLKPNLTLKGKTLKTLLSEAAEWKMNKTAAFNIVGMAWGRSDIPPLRIRFPGFHSKNRYRVWEINELTSTDELRAEGKALNHCVGSSDMEYDAQCFYKEEMSLWSLRKKTHNTEQKRHLTIEVSNGSITQARGKSNRKPTETENAILKIWASIATLEIDI